MAMMHGPTFSHREFMFDKERNQFSAEMSMLSSGSTIEVLGRIYDDAADIGLTIRSERTGQHATYYLHGTVKDDEGDIQYWELWPTTETLRQNPQLSGTKVVIFND